MSDVVELILADHRKFEELMRGLRDAGADRAERRAELSALLVAHAVAEEQEVYPKLRKRRAASDDEIEHGEEEHAEINKALLAFLELEDLDGDRYADTLEELVETVNHHTNEEELTLLNDARTELAQEERDRLGVAFRTARDAQLETNCGRVENVRLLVGRTEHRVDD
ncbi:Hemerythrin HHE cation binding domain-containing protein [Haloechinothrix alba]|uniref:Hemerythrin HHE cation binding domain-containing protein n=1 Tax=Haloechinothrix alba TaxID=664784 RepID=A0A238WJC5_9PSEU|nr:hemerythrin domain-containing protein [Haloechinothrix alba]SNR46686.1 Hemerythrin HHE cation binding domain-containing protein [Haloechinothrix alba]